MTTHNLTSMDDAFLLALRKSVYNNLENEQFGVAELSREIGLCRSQIHRRLYRIKRKSITQYIREIRLDESMQLLKHNVGTAAEIAYKVGFSSPTYFNKCFHEYYGYPPGMVRKNSGAAHMEDELPPEQESGFPNLSSNSQLRPYEVKFDWRVTPFQQPRPKSIMGNSLSIYIMMVLLTIIIFLLLGTYFV